MTTKTKTPGQIWRETVGVPSLIVMYEAELAADAARGGKMPEPPQVDAVALDAAKDAQLELDYQQRRAEGKPTEADLERVEAEQAAYEREIAEKRAWLERATAASPKQLVA